MKKVLVLCTIVFAATLVVACSGDSSPSPVAPDAASLTAPASGSGFTSVSSEVRSNDAVLVCHYNPDWETDGGYEYTVLEVNSTGQLNGHCKVRNVEHDDFTNPATGACGFCDFYGLFPGDPCGSCTVS